MKSYMYIFGHPPPLPGCRTLPEGSPVLLCNQSSRAHLQMTTNLLPVATVSIFRF